jgi:cyclopropane fatty-acyl-phospholipid synthase-like methyltransferase
MRDAEFAPEQFDAITAIYSLFHLPVAAQADLFRRIGRWLRPGGMLLFTYAGRDYTGAERFEGHISFMGHALFYAHTTPEELVAQLEAAGLEVQQLEPRTIGGEIFLWVTAHKPEAAAGRPGS